MIKGNLKLIVSSLLTMLLCTIHIADDIVRGIDRMSLWNLIGVTILVVWLFGVLSLNHRRSGYIIMLLGSLFGALIPITHMYFGISRTLAKFPNSSLLFVWTLWALATLAWYAVILSARGLWTREWTGAVRE